MSERGEAPRSESGSDGAAARGAYLDAASTEPLHPVARTTFLAALDAGYADPRRLHHPGRTARLLLDNARAVVAECLEVRSDEVTFTGSGTEAVHRGLLGLAAADAGRGRRVVLAEVEHAAVRHAAQWWGEPTLVGVDRGARVDRDALAAALAEGPAAAVALQSANHEVGTLQPVDEVELPPGTQLFVDACASMGRVPLPRTWQALAGSAHKWGGPAGVGVLLVRRGARWTSPFPADDRSDHRASGFENVPAALAAAAALQAVVAERDDLGARQHAWIARIRAAAAAIGDVDVVGDPERRLPHLTTFSVLYVNGEQLVTELDRRGFGVASGSACTASTLEPSHVLAAMGALTHGNVRVSLTRSTTDAEVEAFCAVLPEVVAGLRDGS
ncbi:aminotransferase class V-fold PLP-dependent enzyme [Nocardioides sp. 1609]|uniref:cysteine desulfurase family protein n=1 Tax=Nocardioides sp. 1609 TaxID=2508327 RepID=UPI0014310A54|nr:aminotransferase class V-fold PLP-dependent enzyme [Nocardioides sp. 1609]